MKILFYLLGIGLFVSMAPLCLSAQTTAFKYQGSLTDDGSPANGALQMQFKLFDAASGGAQQGTTLTDVPVTVANGVFSVELNFGSAVFTGANRWLEVAVRHNSGESYVTLSPREQIASSPYSLRTLSAAMADDSQKLGGIDANQYATTTSNSFIKNDTALQTANFNISGNGRVGGTFGIGTATPNAGLELRGVGAATQQRITDNASGNSLVLQGGAGENLKVTGYHYGTGTARPLYLSTDGGNTLINSNGGVLGVGTSNPHPGYRADFFGGVRSTANVSTHFVAETTGSTNAWARFYMRSANTDGTLNRSWFIGTSRNFNGDQLYIGDETANQTRFSITPNGPIDHQGNVSQNTAGYGLPKALVYMNESGTMARCYNGVTGSSSGTCGFSITIAEPLVGAYEIDFGFPMNNRFVLATLGNTSGTKLGIRTSFPAGFPNRVFVRIYTVDGGDSPAFFFLAIY